ncbi:MAG: hypothetical protein ACI9EB_000869 [Pseudomonas sp.]
MVEKLAVNAKNPLHGITLEALLKELVDHYGWEGLGQHIDIRCFKHDPNIKSSLIFLRKTPWARDRVESLFIKLRKSQANRPVPALDADPAA